MRGPLIKIETVEQLRAMKLDDIRSGNDFLNWDKGRNPKVTPLRLITDEHVEVFRSSIVPTVIFIAFIKRGGGPLMGKEKHFAADPDNMPAIIEAALEISNNLEIPLWV